MTEQDLIKFKELSMQDGRLNLQWFAEYVAEAEREASRDRLAQKLRTLCFKNTNISAAKSY